jgi:hypothetical protein
MPAIKAQARVVGVTPDPTATTNFEWAATLELNAATTPNGPARKIANVPISQSLVGGKFTLQFSQVHGGILTLTVEAQIDKQVLRASVTGIKVGGTNPSSQLVAQKFPDKTLRQIVAHESSTRQFAGIDAMPLWSGDRKGRVGMMQLTRPAPTDDEVWDWVANMKSGETLLKEKRAVAKAYPAKVRQSKKFQDLVAAYNKARQDSKKPTLTIALPEFSADELEKDTIRGFNGFAGNDAFGFPLHEFRVPVDANGLLLVTENADGKTAAVAWERVPAADRPSVGDPNYVNNVLAGKI